MEKLVSQAEEGSYHVSSFSANTQAEIRRLDAQVDLFWKSEWQLLTRFGLKENMDFLDCGCGPGRLIELLKNEMPGLRCTGLEMDPILVEAANLKLSERGFSDCRVIQGTAEEPGLDRTVRNEAKKALARVLYEKGDFRDAYRLYREIDASELTLADVILEEAWAKYREKDYRRAMGLLVAFNAPSFERLFKPEQYLLKTLIFMQFCHYGAAHEALAAFQDRYGDVLACIRQRGDLTENPQASGILKGLPAVERVEKYLQELQQEKSILVSLQGLEGFVETFQPVYDLKEREVARRLYRVRNREVERLKRILFDYQEQANLLAYESGMHQYKKVKEMYYRTALGDEAKAKEVIPRFSKNTYYEFDGEYWSDELDDYTFVIEDYCETPEKWAEDPGANTQKE